MNHSMAIGADWNEVRFGRDLVFFADRLPILLESMDRQRIVYETWLRECLGQDDHEKTYSWGRLNLVNSRKECFHPQIEYFDPSEQAKTGY